MLKRSVELMQQLLNSLCPPVPTSPDVGQGETAAFSQAALQLQEEVN
jgi:hypothetical protein